MITSFKIFETDYMTLQELLEIDVVVIDEGHKAKNVKTKIRSSLKEIKVNKIKLILTGTPV